MYSVCKHTAYTACVDVHFSTHTLASFPGRADAWYISIVCACAGISVYYLGYYAVKFLCTAKQFTAAYAVKISRARNNRVETGHEYSSSCRFCLKNVASNHSVGLFTMQAIGQDLSGRLSKLLLVPVAQSDGLSQSMANSRHLLLFERQTTLSNSL